MTSPTHDDTTTTEPQTPTETSAESPLVDADASDAGQTTGTSDQALIEELKSSLARSQADYRNLLARGERDRQEMGTFLLSEVARKLLGTADNLERALAHTPNDLAEHSWVAGIRATHASLLKDLAALGIEPFESVGQLLDPSRHDALAREPGKEGVIVREIERGYALRGEHVVRHAKVVVGFTPDPVVA